MFPHNCTCGRVIEQKDAQCIGVNAQGRWYNCECKTTFLMPHGSTKDHQNLVKSFMIEVSKTFPKLMILTYTNGMFRAFDNPDRIVHAGMKGVLDLLVLGKGFYLWFDGKTGNASFTKEQKAFRERLTFINDKLVTFKLRNVKEGIEQIREFYCE